MFVGVLAVRLQLDPSASAADFLRHVSQQMQGALRHPRYPLSELSQSMRLMRTGHTHLLDVLLSFAVQDFGLNFGAAQFVDSRRLFSGLARYPLAVTVCEFDRQADPEMITKPARPATGRANPSC